MVVIVNKGKGDVFFMTTLLKELKYNIALLWLFINIINLHKKYCPKLIFKIILLIIQYKYIPNGIIRRETANAYFKRK